MSKSNSKTKKRKKLDTLVVVPEYKQLKLDAVALTESIALVESIESENPYIYKDIVKDVFRHYVTTSTGQDHILQQLREKQKTKHKWEKCIYVDIIRQIIPYLCQLNAESKLQCGIINLFKLNKYWNRTLKSNPGLWNIYFTKEDHSITANEKYLEIICPPNSTVFLLSTMTFDIIGHDMLSSSDVNKILQYIQRFTHLKYVTLRFIYSYETYQTRQRVVQLHDSLHRINSVLWNIVNVKEVNVKLDDSSNRFSAISIDILSCIQNIHSLNLFHESWINDININGIVDLFHTASLNRLKKLKLLIHPPFSEFCNTVIQHSANTIEHLVIHSGDIETDTKENQLFLETQFSFIKQCIHLKQFEYRYYGTLTMPIPILDYLPNTIEVLRIDFKHSSGHYNQLFSAKHISLCSIKILNIKGYDENTIINLPNIFSNLESFLLWTKKPSSLDVWNIIKELQLTHLKQLCIHNIDTNILDYFSTEKEEQLDYFETCINTNEDYESYIDLRGSDNISLFLKNIPSR